MRMTDTPGRGPASCEHIDLYAAEFYADGEPHAAWRVLRDRAPVWRQTAPDGTPFWSITRHRDAVAVLRDTTTFSSAHGTMLSSMHGDIARGKAMHLTDPPRHRGLRAPTVRILSRSVMRSRQDAIRARLRTLVRSGVASGEVDFARLMALLPMAVAGDIIGIPEERWEETAHWTLASVAPEDPAYLLDDGVDATLQRGHVYLLSLFADLVAQRRRRPAGDLISVLTQMEVEGRLLTDQEVMVNCYGFLIGSNITTPQVASHLALVMAEQPELWQKLRADRTLWPSAVDELLRWSTPTNHLLRRATCDTRLGGEQLPAGALVCVWLASANRDREVFADPFAFHPGRRPNPHIAFGMGPHRCVGDSAARLGVSVLMEQLAEQVACFEMTGAVRHLRSNFLNGVGSLPIVLRSPLDHGSS